MENIDVQVVSCTLQELFNTNIKIFEITGYATNPPLLQWQGNCDFYELVIDDNSDFTSPEIYIKTKYMI